jgi:cytosine/adenosine deaminase-related metal-dependent hydrolase
MSMGHGLPAVHDALVPGLRPSLNSNHGVPSRVLEFATIEGARCANLDGKVGRLTPGETPTSSCRGPTG